MRDVLVFTPVLRLEPETVQALMDLEWEGPLTLCLQRDNPTGDGREDHWHQYERARELFLAGPYEAMLVIESDIVPPRDVLKRLAALEADCAYGVYRFRASNVVNVFERYPVPQPRNMGQTLSAKPRLLRAACRAGVTACSGGGLGVILIRRRVLEAIAFRIDGRRGPHCDTFFNKDVLAHGFSQKADMRLVCGHIDEDGTVLWPDLPEVGR